ncbi:MAG: signal peptidase II [bacterium]|nr:signal peptidase II [bacterium]
MSRFARYALIGGTVIGCIGCDRVTKNVAVEKLYHAAPKHYWNDTVRIQYAENTGAFLGLGDSWPDWLRQLLLVGATSVLLLFVVWHLIRNPKLGVVRTLALALILAGGVGNLWDRMDSGYVVDFMNLGIGKLRTGIFNVADIAITGGVIALVVFGLGPKEDEKELSVEDEAPQASGGDA